MNFLADILLTLREKSDLKISDTAADFTQAL